MKKRIVKICKTHDIETTIQPLLDDGYSLENMVGISAGSSTSGGSVVFYLTR